MAVRRILTLITCGSIAVSTSALASPRSDPTTGRSVFTGATVASPTSITLSPAAIGLDTLGTKLYFAPNVGTRLMLGQRLFLKAEARAYFWNLKYPNSYADEPAQAPGTSDAPNAVNPSGKGGEYTPVPALLFGFGIKF